MSNRTNKRWIRRIVWGAGIWLVLTVLFGPFGYVSICQHCGRARHTTEFQVPLLGLSYFWFHHVEDTNFSSRLGQLVPSHECRWLFGQGGGNGIVCAIGKGHSLLNVVNQPTIVSFIQNVDRFEGHAASQDWIAKSLDPDQADTVRHWLIGSIFPESGFDSEDEYRRWRTRADTEDAELLAPRGN